MVALVCLPEVTVLVALLCSSNLANGVWQQCLQLSMAVPCCIIHDAESQTSPALCWHVMLCKHNKHSEDKRKYFAKLLTRTERC